MDLIQAESINDLINAESEESKKISMMALTGKTSELVAPLKKSFGDILSLIEVNIDYPEYTDIEEATEQDYDLKGGTYKINVFKLDGKLYAGKEGL